MGRDGANGRLWVAFLGFAVAALNVADAQLPVAGVSSVFPAGGQVGTEVEVTVSGKDLDGLVGLEFGHGGIRAARVEHGVDEFGVANSDGVNGFKVSVGKDVPGGVYEVRARGDFGVSNGVLFSVGEVREVLEGGATEVLEMPVVVNGRADDNGIDEFLVNVPAETVVEVSCVAEGIGSRMDPVVEVYGADGGLLGKNNDSVGRDSRVVFSSGAGGECRVRVHDLLFEGGGEYVYRLSVGTAVSAVSVFPNVVERGKETEVLIGYGDGRMERRSVKEVDTGKLGVGSRVGAGLDWGTVDGIVVGVTDLPVVLESESNDDWEAATKLPVPSVAAGQMGVDDGGDRYVFEAKKGDSLVLEVAGDRLGVHADFVLSVFKVTRGEDGAWGESRLVENDDAGWDVGIAEVVRASRDPRTVLAVGEDGTYGVVVRDQFGGARLAKGYALRVGPADPGFRVLLSSSAAVGDQNKLEVTPVVLRAGGTAVVDVWVERRDGFGGDVRLVAEGLREGIECEEAVVSGGESRGRMVLRDLSGEAWSGVVRVFGIYGAVREEGVLHVPRWDVGNRGQERFESRYGGELVVSVIEEPVVFELEAEVGSAEVVIGEKLEVPVKLKVSGELKGELRIVPEGIVGMKKPPELKLKKDQLEGTLVIDCSVTNENQLKAGVQTVVLRGEGQVGGYRAALGRVAEWEEEKNRMDGVVASLEESIKALEAATATAESVNEAKGKRDRAVASRKRVEDFLNRANERSKPQDKREAVFGKPFVLTLKEPVKKEETK